MHAQSRSCIVGKISNCSGAAYVQSGPEAAPAKMPAPSTKAYIESNMKMHHGMAIPFSGDADVDFVRGMIPHHEGAVDMAKIVLEYGQDKKIRKLAQGIIKAQEREIKMMNQWLAAHAVPVQPGTMNPAHHH
ncbi:MAG: DUF305 domain-containing protein [Alphaproteobacteria bacterium]|nr:DUF305 domain-containing protein [Alphaproteobacteria bacterium]